MRQKHGLKSKGEKGVEVQGVYYVILCRFRVDHLYVFLS